MPALRRYKCNYCDFILYFGWGGHLYVEDCDGQRIACKHPGENISIEEVLNLERGILVGMAFRTPSFWWSKKRRAQYDKIKKLVDERTGFHSVFFCPECKNNFYLDIGETGWFSFKENDSSSVKQKDTKKCPECGNKEIKPVREYIGEICPNCGQGEIEEINTGIMS
jgi:predicted RNA-binding Zn-ribbon protein involved in translation (DUF1610 family)